MKIITFLTTLFVYLIQLGSANTIDEYFHEGLGFEFRRSKYPIANYITRDVNDANVNGTVGGYCTFYNYADHTSRGDETWIGDTLYVSDDFIHRTLGQLQMCFKYSNTASECDDTCVDTTQTQNITTDIDISIHGYCS